MKIFQKPEGYTEVFSEEEWEAWIAFGWIAFGWTSWIAFGNDHNWGTPRCSANLIRGSRAGVEEIHHQMDASCRCEDNRGTKVRCAIRTNDDSMFLGKHLPGFCPALRYRPRAGKQAIKQQKQQKQEANPK